jgi:hypothetical protein
LQLIAHPAASDSVPETFLLSRAYALALSTTGFALRSVQTHISKQIRIEMCVCTLFNANPVVERVGAHALKGKNNFLPRLLAVQILEVTMYCIYPGHS